MKTQVFKLKAQEGVDAFKVVKLLLLAFKIPIQKCPLN